MISSLVFRRIYSTDTCLLYLTDCIRKELNLCGMVLLDLQKAFDTVNHSILLDKVGAMGFSDTVKSWVASYLSGREQRVEVGGMLSESKTVYNVVPQGSVLGPLLFLLYINDNQAVFVCNMFLYADDDALLASGKETNKIQEKLGEELVKVKDWLSENKLLLHLGKTESIIFGSKYKLSKEDDLVIKVDGMN